jgi:HEAT repeat protein
LGSTHEKAGAPEGVVHSVIRTLTDPDPVVRQTATRSLGYFKNETALTLPAIRRALKDKDKNIRESAKRAAGILGKKAEKLIPDLIFAIKNEPDFTDDKSIIEERMRTFELALVDNFNSRISTIAALGEIGEKANAAIPFLVDNLERFEKYLEYPMVKQLTYTTATALGKIGGKEAFEALALALKKPNRELSDAAAHGIAKIGGKDAIRTLVLASKEYPGVLEALGEIDGKEALQAIILILKDGQAAPHLRSAAAAVLGDMGEKALEAYPELSRISQDGDVEYLRRAAYGAKEKILKKVEGKK